MQEESLVFAAQKPETLATHLAAELHLRRVVRDDHLVRVGDALAGPTDVRLHHVTVDNLRVIHEAVETFQIRIVVGQDVRHALARRRAAPRHNRFQPRVAAAMPQGGALELHHDGWHALDLLDGLHLS